MTNYQIRLVKTLVQQQLQVEQFSQETNLISYRL